MFPPFRRTRLEGRSGVGTAQRRDQSPGDCLLHPSVSNSRPEADVEVPPITWTLLLGEEKKRTKGRSAAVSFSFKVMSANFLSIVSACMQQNLYCHRGNWEMWLSLQLGFPEEGLPAGSDGKESACPAGDLCSIPGLGRSPGEENSHPLQRSGPENAADRGAGRATAPGVAESDRTDDFHFQCSWRRKWTWVLGGDKLPLQLCRVYSWHWWQFCGLHSAF